MAIPCPEQFAYGHSLTAHEGPVIRQGLHHLAIGPERPEVGVIAGIAVNSPAWSSAKAHFSRQRPADFRVLAGFIGPRLPGCGIHELGTRRRGTHAQQTSHNKYCW